MKVGVAKVDITLDVGKKAVRLHGYLDKNRKKGAIGVLDRIYARALVGQDESGNLFGLVSADMCYIATELRDEVLKRLASFGFNDDNLMLAATHTHSSFAGYDRTFIARALFGGFDEEILLDTAERIAKAVIDAKESMSESTIEIGSKDVKGLNRSRLDPAFYFGDGKAEQKVLPNPEKYPVDEKMTVLKLNRLDGRPKAVVIHYSAHPTILSPKNLQISADYCGVLCKKVEDALRNDAIALFINGTLGDTAPLPDWEDSVEKEIVQMNDYGTALANEALKALEKTEPLEVDKVVSKTVIMKAPQIVLRPLGRIKLPYFLSKLFYAKSEIPYQAMRIGKLILLAVPAEPTTEVGRELKSLCPSNFQSLIVAPANSYLEYLVTKEQYEQSGFTADHCFFGPNASDYVKGAFQKALAGVL